RWEGHRHHQDPRLHGEHGSLARLPGCAERVLQGRVSHRHPGRGLPSRGQGHAHGGRSGGGDPRLKTSATRSRRGSTMSFVMTVQGRLAAADACPTPMHVHILTNMLPPYAENLVGLLDEEVTC